MGWVVTLRALRRRWYVVVVGLLVTVGLGAGAVSVVAPTYQVSGTVLLMPSAQQREQEGNPFLGLGSLSATGLILAARLNSDAEVEQIVQGAPEAGYTVGPDPTLGEPALLVTAWDETEQGALNVLDRVLEEIPIALDQVQQEVDVPQDATIGSIPLTRDLEPEKVTKATQRALVAALAGGLALTIGAAVGLDALLGRRRRNRASTAADAALTGPGVPDGTASGDHAPVAPEVTVSQHAAEPLAAPAPEPPTFTGVITLGATRRQAANARTVHPPGPAVPPNRSAPMTPVQWPGTR